VAVGPTTHRATVCGAGGQAGDQVQAALAIRDLNHITIVSSRRETAAKPVNRLRQEFPHVEFHGITTPQEALGNSRLVCCATSSKLPTVQR
jgi:ornithine cyclodeaminase/alanine dehydrogenase-like protein (mu-crystallin family)